MTMQTKIILSGKDLELVEDRDYDLAIEAAKSVFASHGADPLACEAANQKFCDDVELDRDEALHCAIWEAANYEACKAATIGWMSRDVDLYILVKG